MAFKPERFLGPTSEPDPNTLVFGFGAALSRPRARRLVAISDHFSVPGRLQHQQGRRQEGWGSRARRAIPTGSDQPPAAFSDKP